MRPRPPSEPLTADDVAAVTRQLGREPRGVLGVAFRCPCGQPAVLRTAPRLPDGTPFPTMHYLTCPRASGLIGTLESSGMMREMEGRLASDPQLAAQYRKAHEGYVAERDAVEHVEEIDGISAGGMPARVKCLHVLAADALARGEGVNPLGDEVVAALGDWWSAGPCAEADA